jgi:uncharacterized protein YijF (DUF1287 family)
MLRRTFLGGSAATLVVAQSTGKDKGLLVAQAASRQIGVTLGYDPAYRQIPYPNGDVPRSTGVCADVIVRAGRAGPGSAAAGA